MANPKYKTAYDDLSSFSKSFRKLKEQLFGLISSSLICRSMSASAKTQSKKLFLGLKINERSSHAV